MGRVTETTDRVRPRAGAASIGVRRHFTRAGQDVFDSVVWEIRTARIERADGEVVFEQKDVEVPRTWSALATNIVASKYFRGHLGAPNRERSVRQLIGRVVRTLRGWGREGGYFADDDEEQTFSDELTHLLLHQKACFNSPVWFNLGVVEPNGQLVPQQASACFINSVEDTMQSIMDLAKTEAMLFKGGSGTGSNLSTIRSSREKLAGGGSASGPVSFMRGFDSFAGVIRSGGKTRRAAKMVILNADHPDILDFVRCKADEERKAWALIDAGYDGNFNVAGGAYESIQYQNANHSVRVTDSFMKAVTTDGPWQTHVVTTGEVMDTHRARDIMQQIAEAAHACGDPGLQYDTTINRWNPVKNTGRINATNPCSEYIFLDDTACNLSSLNLLRFADERGRFLVDDFRAAVDTMLLAMEIIVDFAAYPTPRIAENSHRLRPLGLGYANLGALLMLNGLPYDSDEGRNLAAALTSLMCGHAYRRSAEVARRLGPFEEYERNRVPFLEVIGLHKEYGDRIELKGVAVDLHRAALASWAEALELGRAWGYRNGQVTVLAPTGTIAFMMDCDTTGIEPDIALVKYKQLVGEGMLKIVNRVLPLALRNLPYTPDQVEVIAAYVEKHDTIEGAPELREEHLPIFDCAFLSPHGKRAIHHMGHVRMMGAVQPFLSGGISKTVNMPMESTTDDIMEAYVEGWKLGLKSLAIYRDGSKRTQPLSTQREPKQETASQASAEAKPLRRKLPDVRQAITHKFSIAGHDGYLTVGLYEDGQPGEMFLRMAKEGSTISGLMDTVAIMTSIALQYGVPLKALVDKFSHTRFEPAGFTQNPEIPFAKSVTDYVFRWLGLNFSKGEPDAEDTQETEAEAVGLGRPGGERVVPIRGGSHLDGIRVGQEDAPPCMNCGSIMLRTGACHSCPNCGENGGCG
ncbi:MAG: vitamin B12-dependent ribonucleotide reductase [Deltaproteobacteria bacterium]|nr:vitamin B12-dependent ribonucleotide reductase [Deltaproteobacteria bacterium]